MSLDGSNNEVRVILAGDEVIIVESYHVSISMFVQPAKFSVVIGNGAVARELLDKYPPGTPFELQIAGTTQFIGKTDGWAVSGAAGNTSITLTGRDALAPVHDAFVDAEKTWTDISIKDLVDFVLAKVLGAGKYTLAASNSAARKAMSNASGKGKITKSAKKLKAATVTASGSADVSATELATFSDKGVFTKAAVSGNRKIQATMGKRWYGDILKPQLDRAGLFLWCSQGGTYLLAELDPDQAPLYRIRHRRGAVDNIVESFSYTQDTADRYASCTVWGRRGGGKEKRTKISGTYVDDQMTEAGITKVMHISDDKCTSIEQAEFLAKREIAKTRRDGRRLSYTVGGHTTTQAGGTQTVIWIPDTVVDVDDEELGLQFRAYVESVEHSGSPAMTTTISLMSCKDVVFGEEAPE